MSDSSVFDPARRKLLAGLAGSAAGAAVLTACGSSSQPDSADTPAAPTEPTTQPTTQPTPLPPATDLPDPSSIGIDHVVVVMMENRSFDHYFGWLPGADGKQAGFSYSDSAGTNFETYHLEDFQSCGSADPDHGYEGGRTHYNDGKMDGWLLTSPAGDKFPIGYFEADDLPFFKACTENWTICDRYFSGTLSSTYPNRIYMHTGQTDRLSNTPDSSKLPAIWDRLSDKGVNGTYFFNDLPLTALFGNRFVDISKPYPTFLAMAQAGQLPAVSFVDPSFGGEATGTSNDDHPLADVRDGQAFLNQVYEALRGSPQWDKTLLVINYDEWGGFRDHVPPPLAPVSDDESKLGNDGRLGFRVPCVLIGPRVKKAHIEHTQLDPNSILNFICWRFGLDGLGTRAATSANLAYALDLQSAPRTDKPAFDVPSGPFGQVCQVQTMLPAGAALSSLPADDRSKAEHLLEIETLRLVARRNGFAV